MFKYNLQFETSMNISVADMKAIIESGYGCIVVGTIGGLLIKIQNFESEIFLTEENLIKIGKTILPNKELRSVGSAEYLGNHNISRTFIHSS